VIHTVIHEWGSESHLSCFSVGIYLCENHFSRSEGLFSRVHGQKSIELETVVPYSHNKPNYHNMMKMKVGTMPARSGGRQWLATMIYLQMLQQMINSSSVHAFAPPQCQSRALRSNELFMSSGDGSDTEWVKGKLCSVTVPF
jgi:hypothetical protein